MVRRRGRSSTAWGTSARGSDFYNCNNAQEISDIGGLKKLGTHGIPPLVGRGVIVNMAKHKGVTAMAAGDTISPADIQAAARAQNVTFKAGDIILFHTGWTDAKLASDPKAWVSGEPGLDNAAAVYLAGLNPIAVGADTWGVEALPPKQGDKIFYVGTQRRTRRGSVGGDREPVVRATTRGSRVGP